MAGIGRVLALVTAVLATGCASGFYPQDLSLVSLDVVTHATEPLVPVPNNPGRREKDHDPVLKVTLRSTFDLAA